MRVISVSHAIILPSDRMTEKGTFYTKLNQWTGPLQRWCRARLKRQYDGLVDEVTNIRWGTDNTNYCHSHLFTHQIFCFDWCCTCFVDENEKLLWSFTAEVVLSWFKKASTRMELLRVNILASIYFQKKSQRL